MWVGWLLSFIELTVEHVCFQMLACVNSDYLPFSRSHLELDLVIVIGRTQCPRRNSMIPNCSWEHLGFSIFSELGVRVSHIWWLLWLIWKCTFLKTWNFTSIESLLGCHSQLYIAQSKTRLHSRQLGSKVLMRAGFGLRNKPHNVKKPEVFCLV